jgi:hypothetical protein
MGRQECPPHNTSNSGKADGGGAGAFIGNLRFQGSDGIERSLSVRAVLLALINGFEVAGSEVANSMQGRFYSIGESSFRLEVFTEELFFPVIGERQVF